MLRSFRVMLAASAAMALFQSTAIAATRLQAPASAACAGGGCVQNYRLEQIFNAGSLPTSGPIGSIALDRSLLGNFRNSMFRITFWTNGGSTQVGDFGSFDLSVLGGEFVTLGGPGFEFDGSQGDLIMRLDFVRPAARGVGGGGGGGGAAAFFTAGPSLPGAQLALDGLDEPIILTPPDPEDILPPGGSPVADLVIMVPEPPTWILAIAGFGLTGAMLRRRGKAATA